MNERDRINELLRDLRRTPTPRAISLPSSASLPKRITPDMLDGVSRDSISPDMFTVLTKGQLGSSVSVNANKPNELQTIVDISGPDECATVLSVTLLRPDTVNVSPATRQFPIATIEWGTGGVVATAVIDFMQGATFTVAASHLKIKVQDDSQDVAIITYRVGAFVSLMATSKVTPLYRTLNAYTVGLAAALQCNALNSAQTFIIPDFATALQVKRSIGNPHGGGTPYDWQHAITIQLLTTTTGGGTAVTSTQETITVGSNQQCPWIPLTAHSRGVCVIHSDVVQTAEPLLPRLHFQIGIN